MKPVDIAREQILVSDSYNGDNHAVRFSSKRTMSSQPEDVPGSELHPPMVASFDQTVNNKRFSFDAIESSLPSTSVKIDVDGNDDQLGRSVRYGGLRGLPTTTGDFQAHITSSISSTQQGMSASPATTNLGGGGGGEYDMDDDDDEDGSGTSKSKSSLAGSYNPDDVLLSQELLMSKAKQRSLQKQHHAFLYAAADTALRQLRSKAGDPGDPSIPDLSTPRKGKSTRNVKEPLTPLVASSPSRQMPKMNSPSISPSKWQASSQKVSEAPNQPKPLNRQKLEEWQQEWLKRRNQNQEAVLQLELARRLKKHGLQSATLDLITDERRLSEIMSSATGIGDRINLKVKDVDSVESERVKTSSQSQLSSPSDDNIFDHFPLPDRKSLEKSESVRSLGIPVNNDELDESDEEAIELLYKHGKIEADESIDSKRPSVPRKSSIKSVESTDTLKFTNNGSSFQKESVLSVGFDVDETSEAVSSDDKPILRERRLSTPGLNSMRQEDVTAKVDAHVEEVSEINVQEAIPFRSVQPNYKKLASSASLVALLGIHNSHIEEGELSDGGGRLLTPRFSTSENNPLIHAQRVVAIRPARMRITSDKPIVSRLHGSNSEQQSPRSRSLRISPSSSMLHQDLTQSEAAKLYPDLAQSHSHVVYTSGIIIPHSSTSKRPIVTSSSSTTRTQDGILRHSQKSARRSVSSVLSLKDGLTIRDAVLENEIVPTAARPSLAPPEQLAAGVVIASRSSQSRLSQKNNMSLAQRQKELDKSESDIVLNTENSLEAHWQSVNEISDSLLGIDPEIIAIKRKLREIILSSKEAYESGQNSSKLESGGLSREINTCNVLDEPLVVSQSQSSDDAFEVASKASSLSSKHRQILDIRRKDAKLSSSLSVSKSLLNLLNEGTESNQVSLSEDHSDISSIDEHAKLLGSKSPSHSKKIQRTLNISKILKTSASVGQLLKSQTGDGPHYEIIEKDNEGISKKQIAAELSDFISAPTTLNFRAHEGKQDLNPTRSLFPSTPTKIDEETNASSDGHSDHSQVVNQETSSRTTQRALRRMVRSAEYDQVKHLREGIRHVLRAESSLHKGTGNIGKLNSGYNAPSEYAPHVVDDGDLRLELDTNLKTRLKQVELDSEHRRSKLPILNTGLIRVKPIVSARKNESKSSLPVEEAFDVVQVVTTQTALQDTENTKRNTSSKDSLSSSQTSSIDANMKLRANGFFPHSLREFKTASKLTNAARAIFRKDDRRGEPYSTEEKRHQRQAQIESLLKRGQSYNASMLKGEM